MRYYSDTYKIIRATGFIHISDTALPDLNLA